MYIFEFIAKNLTKKKKQQTAFPVAEDADYEKCNHTFLPIDSTGETLACSKCGQITKNNFLMYKSKNPFT